MRCWMIRQSPRIQIACGAVVFHSIGLAEHSSVAGCVNRRKPIIPAAIANDPYSSSTTQPGSTHGRPTARRCQTIYVGMMLTVQMTIGNVDVDRRNGSSQRRYHG